MESVMSQVPSGAVMLMVTVRSVDISLAFTSILTVLSTIGFAGDTSRPDRSGATVSWTVTESVLESQNPELSANHMIISTDPVASVEYRYQ